VNFASGVAIEREGPLARQGNRVRGPDPCGAFHHSLVAFDGDKRFFRATQQARPDVTKYFGLSETKKPGFDITLDLEAVRGPQTIDIYTISGGKAYGCGSRLRLE